MTRRPRDYYPTPAWCLYRLAEVVDLGRLGAPERNQHGVAAGCAPIQTAWEPAAGRGHLADVIEQCIPAGVRLVRTDIEPWPDRYVQGLDFFDYYDGHAQVAPDLIITNPPYSLADAFVRRALDLVAMGGAVVMLLRITWLGGAEEAHPGHWIYHHPPSVYVLPERPQFVAGAGSDSAPVAWCIWRDAEFSEHLRHYSARFRVLPTTPLRERRHDERHVQHEDHREGAQTSLF